MLKCILSHSDYIAAIDLVRRKNRFCYSNLFQNAKEFLETLREHETHMLQFADQGVFIFVCYHEAYYDMLFACSSKIFLGLPKNEVFCNFLTKIGLPVRVGITGRYEKINEDSKIFLQCGFLKKRTVGKISYGGQKNEYAEFFKRSYSSLQVLENKNANNDIEIDSGDLEISFAEVKDAKEIFQLLCEEFDLIEDSIPEPIQIESDIRNKFVAVIKKKGKIIAVNYYRIKNRIRSCIYECVKKGYRTNGTVFFLNDFVDNYVANNENVVRTYGWRDVTKKRLINVYRALGENFCNIYTTYLLYKNND